MLNREGNWDLFDDYVIIDKTMDTTSVLNDTIYHYSRGNEKIFSAKIGKHRYRGKIINLFDAGNRPVGEMVSLIDISDQYRNLQIMVAVIATITILLGAVLLLTFNFYIGGIQKRLIESRATIRQEIQTRRQKEHELAESEKRFRSLFEDSMDTILIAGKDGHLQMLNPAGKRLFQLSAQDVKTSNFNDFFCDSGVARNLLEKLSTNGAVRDFGAQLQNSNGKEMDCLITLTSKTDKNGRFVSYEGIIRDVTPYKKMEEELRRLATTDSLTGVNNRRYFINLAEKELKRCRRYGHTSSLLMFDIDNFKRINDTYGHAAGDQVLKRFSSLCLGEIRECDIFGRLGGEEFAIILIETDLSSAKIVAERIREVLEFHVMNVNDSELRITASIGISEFQPADEPRALQIMMERADKALYDAKSNGKNQVSVWHG
jgi:diguanylate cyclase (GGDEF)-like protein/PAS domain S-box-containing protein